VILQNQIIDLLTIQDSIEVNLIEDEVVDYIYQILEIIDEYDGQYLVVYIANEF
jgi:hypothetical protein